MALHKARAVNMPVPVDIAKARLGWSVCFRVLRALVGQVLGFRARALPLRG